MTRFAASLGDITTLGVDAIVNAANSSLLGGGGVDGAIHRAGGPTIVDECRAIVARQGPLRTGDAVITGAGRLPATFVIHTVGPVWTGDDADRHDRLLASCYTSSLDLAVTNDVHSIAFPNISTGVYRFPKDRAANVARGAVAAWVAEHPGAVEEIHFVCFDQDNLALYEDLVRSGWEASSP